MKRFVVIGLGHFGSWAARALTSQGHEVVAVEKNEELVDRYGDQITRAVAGDATDRALLDELGAGEADAAVISTGGDLAATILATQALKDLGLEEIYVKVTSEEAARALEAFDVREAIFPEQEVAFRLAHRLPSQAVLDYVPLGRSHSIQELAIPNEWLGETLRDLELPREHGIQVVAILDLLTDDLRVVPDPDEPLKDSDVAVVAGRDEDITALLKENR